ncbi:hypothetical protein ACFFX1_11875 [Dactylosporangium sucinum]|uniref:Uncharacterized protein n=1 Tax=Dactylosporangium sucinum TaxID=1424081 RepID=A0A917WTN5_9ACTN|nr:hypothetical protein [Dactylosporangium sucinum]GGM27675.1 hypothetical protein GCM10007977_031150 [Dactylosporangium sucinum]
MATVSVEHDCPLCIEGFAPCGIDPVLGPVMQFCPTQPHCDSCGGAVFPTDADCMPQFADLMAARGYHAIFCPACTGVIVLIRIGEGF